MSTLQKIAQFRIWNVFEGQKPETWKTPEKQFQNECIWEMYGSIQAWCLRLLITAALPSCVQVYKENTVFFVRTLYMCVCIWCVHVVCVFVCVCECCLCVCVVCVRVWCVWIHFNFCFCFTAYVRTVKLNVGKNPLVCDEKIVWMKISEEMGWLHWFDYNFGGVFFPGKPESTNIDWDTDWHSTILANITCEYLKCVSGQ